MIKMGGITITSVKVVGMCSKCRREKDEIKKDCNGRIYEDKELSCVCCSIGCTHIKPKEIVE